ncbi:hypothetical protein WJ63_32960 [Burkholderia pyrrocinia]|nr:hypothetical protein WJ63_32960 [Burkholderia pyrrocinia]
MKASVQENVIFSVRRSGAKARPIVAPRRSACAVYRICKQQVACHACEAHADARSWCALPARRAAQGTALR